MQPTDVLIELSRRGVEIAVAGDHLRFRPREAVSDELRAEIVEHKAELLQILEDEEHEVRWRMDAMRGQVPRRGVIPTLLARPETKFSPKGTCRHCGDQLPPDRPVTCAPCLRAVYLLLNQIREGV